MNRVKQLCEAIRSCLCCNLPEKTEFIILDNASNDDTSTAIASLKAETFIDIKYFRMKENLGVGIGRNYALKYATGDYIYMLDDDAVISGNNKHFFEDAINVLDNHLEIASLTTQIYDTVWKANRITRTHLKLYDDIYKCYMPCGGSHFLRRSYFDLPIYFPNKYGYEEIATAMQANNKGYENVFYPSLLVIHNPPVNKWVVNSDNKNHFINDFASQYAIKRIMYPRMVLPILWLTYQYRCFKYLRGLGLRLKGQEIVNNLLKSSNDFKRIKLSTLMHLYKDYGFSIF